MNKKISVVINTLNEARNLEVALKSLGWVDEIVVVDMYSEDDSVEIAKKFGAKIFLHKRMSFVEPARNFAISKATGDWVLVLDPDEEVTKELAVKLRGISEDNLVDFVKIPRKNFIFNKWMKASMWWPDYNIRFFKKGKVKWWDRIHIPPETTGMGLDLSPEEDLAIVHHHYTNVGQFIERMNRYTSVQAEELVKGGYEFDWKDLISKPLGEFLGRYFANKGFRDGIHGLSLALLQASSFLIMYLKIWEAQGFKQQDISLKEAQELSKKGGNELKYWFKYGDLSDNSFKRLLQRVKNKLT